MKNRHGTQANSDMGVHSRDTDLYLLSMPESSAVLCPIIPESALSGHTASGVYRAVTEHGQVQCRQQVILIIPITQVMRNRFEKFFQDLPVNFPVNYFTNLFFFTSSFYDLLGGE